MKVSVIVAVYKDIESLDLIVQALKKQTYTNIELVVAEDNNSQDMKDYISSIDGLEVKHTYQEDNGVQKARSLNNAILASSGEYLVFVDGDIIPYTTFIDGHVSLSERGKVLSGRRLNLNAKLSKDMRSGKIKSWNLEKNIFVSAFSLIFDRNARFEQGIYINPRGYIYNKFIKNRNRNVSLIGCNFSCFKDDMLTINGFDEGYGETSFADDMDLEWRFKAYGLSIKSCKNVANTFHLDHKKQNNPQLVKFKKRFEENKKSLKYVCEFGLNTH